MTATRGAFGSALGCDRVNFDALARGMGAVRIGRCYRSRSPATPWLRTTSASPDDQRRGARAGEPHPALDVFGHPVAMSQVPPVLLPNARFNCEASSASQARRAVRQLQPTLGNTRKRSPLRTPRWQSC